MSLCPYCVSVYTWRSSQTYGEELTLGGKHNVSHFTCLHRDTIHIYLGGIHAHTPGHFNNFNNPLNIIYYQKCKNI